MNLFVSSVTLISLFIYNIFLSVVLLLTPRRYRRKKDIRGQKVLITGAGNGLGRQLAIQFSKRSTCLILLDIDKVALMETSKLLDPQSKAFIFECDVSKRKMVYAVAERIKNDVGDIDILVNNAGIVCGKSLIDLPDEKIMKTLEVNTISHFWICKAFIPAMMARNSGHIVTIASAAGRFGVGKLTDYCASKYAAIGFSEALEVEMRAKNLDGIKMTIVCPYHMTTNLFTGFKANGFPSITAEYAAAEIVEGVLEEEETVFLPHYFKYAAMFKSVIPRWLYLAYLEQTGNLNIMAEFTGRTDNNN